jgi:hypothetical protein
MMQITKTCGAEHKLGDMNLVPPAFSLEAPRERSVAATKGVCSIDSERCLLATVAALPWHHLCPLMTGEEV